MFNIRAVYFYDIIKLMNKYTKKQFKIALIFIAILIVIIGGIWLLTKSGSTTCFDQIQNQGETGIDCGGPCGPCAEDIRDPLIVVSSQIIPTTDNYFDLVLEIKNSNSDWGVESVTYVINFLDSNNELISSKDGKTYILPEQNRYIVEQKLSVDNLIKVNIELKDIEWIKLKDFKEIDLKIKNSGYNLTNGIKLFGTVNNNSSFDLDKIEIVGLLFKNNNLVSAGQTNIRTVVMQENRYFEINWPTNIEFDSFELKPYTNMFLNSNFIKTHGTIERFKEY